MVGCVRFGRWSGYWLEPEMFAWLFVESVKLTLKFVVPGTVGVQLKIAVKRVPAEELLVCVQMPKVESVIALEMSDAPSGSVTDALMVK